MCNIKRCHWVDLNSINYIHYHDNEWCVPVHDDNKLFEFLVLESFQAGLSWITILNKRENFRKAFDNFDPVLISQYDAEKIETLKNDKGIIRNGRKIMYTIKNAQIFLQIQKEFGSFDKYIWGFTNGRIIYGDGVNLAVSSELSDTISKDLYSRGMRFVGTIIIYSYIQAIGIVNDHDKKCYKFVGAKNDY